MVLAGCDDEEEKTRLYDYQCNVPDFNSPITYTREEVTYDSIEGIDLLATIYKPDTDAISPGMVAVHGGGWITGTRDYLEGFCDYYAKRGFVIMNIEYRLGNNTYIYPGMIQDVISAIRYFRNQAENYNLDPNCLGVMGSSAGGHLSTLAGYVSDDTTLYRDCSGCGQAGGETRFVVSYYGVYDFVYDESMQVLAGTMLEGDTLFDDASPITYADDKQIHLWFAHGTEDQVVNIVQAYSMRDHLESANKDYTFLELQGYQHFFVNGETVSDDLLSTFPNLEEFFTYALTH